MHVGCLIGFGYIGHKWPQYEQSLADEINAERLKRGMTPMVGTGSYWLKYSLPDHDDLAEMTRKG
jgi:hypothetical protein